MFITCVYIIRSSESVVAFTVFVTPRVLAIVFGNSEEGG